MAREPFFDPWDVSSRLLRRTGRLGIDTAGNPSIVLRGQEQQYLSE
jgi:hypothetical protein